MKKTIIAIMLFAGIATAQERRPLWYAYGNGAFVTATNDSANTNIYGYAAGAFKPAYGSLSAYLSPYEVADSVFLTNATISSGTVTNTWIQDGYLVIANNGSWENYFVFSNSTTCPRIFDFHGRFEGIPAHTVKFQAFDYTNGVYTNFTDLADDLPASTSDSSLRFSFPDPSANYCNTNGESRIRVIGTTLSAYDFYYDWLRLTYATAVCTNAGEWYPLAGFSVGQSNNIIPDATAGTIKTVDAGDYNWEWHVSFGGKTNVAYAIRHLTNGTPSGVQSIRTIGGSPQIGSMSAFGGGRIPASCTNSWQVSADSDNAFVVFVNGTAKVRKDAD